MGRGGNGSSSGLMFIVSDNVGYFIFVFDGVLFLGSWISMWEIFRGGRAGSDLRPGGEVGAVCLVVNRLPLYGAPPSIQGGFGGSGCFSSLAIRNGVRESKGFFLKLLILPLLDALVDREIGDNYGSGDLNIYC